MAEDVLQGTIAALKVRDVYQRECNITLSDDFDAITPPTEVSIQFKIGAKSSALIKVGENDHLLRAYISCGLRFLDAENPEDVLADIEAIFVSDYDVKPDSNLIQEGIDKFCQENAVFNVWPYFREYVHSVCARCRLPSVTLPMFQLTKRDNPNHDNEM